MAKRYVVKKGYEGSDVVVSQPLGSKYGRIALDSCSQRELKYLHDVVKFAGVTVVDNGKKN